MNKVEDALKLDKLSAKNNIKFNNSVEHTLFDLELYSDVKEGSLVMQTSVNKGNLLLKTFENLSEDIFMNLYKYKPRIRESTDMFPSRQYNHSLLTKLNDTDEFKRLQKICKLDLINSSLGTEIIHDRALSNIQEVIKKYESQIEASSEPNVLVKNVIETINNLVDEENKIFSISTDDLSSNAGGRVQLSNENLPPQVPLTQDELEELTKDLSTALKDATQNACDEVKEVSDIMRQWSLEGGEHQRVSIESIRTAVERIRNSKALMDFTELLGQLREVAKTSLKRKAKGEAGSIKTVTSGNSLNKMLPTEKALLSSEILKPLFIKKYTEKQLLEYEVENNKRKGMGPIIVCLDTSGSMKGKQIEWGKALCVAMLEIALKQKRDAHIMMFDTNVYNKWTFLKGEAEPNDIVDIASIKASGGTNFYIPLERSLDIISNAKDFKKADVTFITDGDCALNEEQTKKVKNVKNQRRVKIQSVIINVGGHCCISGIEDWSDSVLKISDIVELNDTLASNIFNFSSENE